MLRIDCPFCGLRDMTEFTYGEDASIVWPDFASPDHQAHFDALYLRENPRGRHLEKWQHLMGCRSWLLVERDTLTHEIFSVRAAAEAGPGSGKLKRRSSR
jgi:heterotetrameric sarcosine oxidase delta subunit